MTWKKKTYQLSFIIIYLNVIYLLQHNITGLKCLLRNTVIFSLLTYTNRLQGKFWFEVSEMATLKQ